MAAPSRAWCTSRGLVDSAFLMRATAEPVEGNRVRLSVVVDESEVDQALDATVRRLVKKIRNAIASRDASTLLAGLDEYFGRQPSA